MSVGADEIRTVLEKYLAEYPDEVGRLARLADALAHSATLTSPAEARGHLTSAAVLIDPSWRVLHLHYPRWSRWLLPGGHLTAADDSLPGAALREVYERAGIDPDTVVPLPGFEVTPIDIDIHRIPPDRAKGRPEHWHFEIRYAYQIAGTPTIRLDPDDPGEPAWLAPDAIPGFPLRLKLRALHHALAAS